jgi:hypothetical protein
MIPLPQLQARELPSAGSHLAALWSLIHHGTQPYVFEGRTGFRPQLEFGWELVDQFMADGRPFVISRLYSYSMHPNAALRADLEGWFARALTAKEFASLDLVELIGFVAVVGIKHEFGRSGTVYANLGSLSKPPAGVPTRHRLINQPVVLSPAAFDPAVYRALPEWKRNKLAQAPEYQAALKGGGPSPEQLGERLRAQLAAPQSAEARADPELDDEIPF